MYYARCIHSIKWVVVSHWWAYLSSEREICSDAKLLQSFIPYYYYYWKWFLYWEIRLVWYYLEITFSSSSVLLSTSTGFVLCTVYYSVHFIEILLPRKLKYKVASLRIKHLMQLKTYRATTKFRITKLSKKGITFHIICRSSSLPIIRANTMAF